MAGYMTTVRIYNDPKDKHTFIKQMVQDFQEYEDISDFKATVFELTKEYLSDKNISLQDVIICFCHCGDTFLTLFQEKVSHARLHLFS